MTFGKIVIHWVLIVLLFVVAGCGQKNVLPPSAKKTVSTGGRLVYGSLQEPNTLNPLLSDLLATAEVGSLIFSGLVTMNDKGEWIGDLATQVPSVQNGGVSRDGLTVTYKLRKGVTWHDGAPFTADDVVFTWKLIMNPKVNVVSRDGYDKLASITTPAPHTVVLHFKEYYAPYLTLFPTILPRHILENVDNPNKADFNRAPVGTGPFKFKEWRMAEAIVLDANPAYFRGKPVLDGIDFRILPDTNILLTQLKAGELDIVSDINRDQLDQIKAIEGIRTVITPNMVWEHLDFNLDRPLFRDVQVRKAIAMAIDVPAIINTILKNAASQATGDQSPLSWAYNPAVKPLVRNSNGARNLLLQDGWQPENDGIFAKNGRRLSFSLVTTKGNKLRELVGQAIVQQLKEAGVEAELRPVDPAVFFNDLLKRRRFDVAMYAWASGVDPDDLSLWHSGKIPGAGNGYEGQNYPGWRNAEIDRLTELGRSAVDLETRRQTYFRIQELIREECPVVPLYFHANVAAVKNTVANYKPAPTPGGSLWNAWQWGWNAK
ncbi:Hypothetical protein LUCI_4034 [Lucifera butyrica]|uniref:Solute-binding protein family 5 domain-containing protein n=1 Tax=Lucifera butyrica TaxID=1351585 RepID=A0A498RCK3_9FIRM|nr:peptide ABC transporter substrate-binding protein [Lucifera butyrica]VBB08755.1 Hypothetical protein LUCI_4034 [Lucifera butyrica]